MVGDLLQETLLFVIGIHIVYMLECDIVSEKIRRLFQIVGLV